MASSIKRVILDTNIYELLLKYLEIDKIRKIKERSIIIFYGTDIIRIIACAAIHQLDIVISNDNKTMLSPQSKKAYTIVHDIRKLNTPKFINFEEFKELLGGVKLD